MSPSEIRCGPLRRLFSIFPIILIVLLSIQSLSASDFYKWTDERGTVHFSNSLSDVPARYRDQVEKRAFKKKKKRKGTSEPSEDLSDPSRQDNAPLNSGTIETPPAARKRHLVPYRDHEGSVRRVIIEVTFHDRVTVPMVFDTGAFETLIFPELADQLGLFAQDQPMLQVPSGGIGGSAPSIRTIIDSMRVGDFRRDFVPIKIIDRLSNAFEGIIGLDFISDYFIRINPKKKLVLFEEMASETQRYGGHDELWWRNYFTEFGFYRHAWTERIDYLEDRLREERMTFSAQKSHIQSELSLAKYFQQESVKLFDRLNRHATEHSVPVHWRRAKN